MAAATNIQNSNVQPVKQSYFQSAANKLAPVAQATQNAAKSVLSFCTHPLVVYFAASNVIFSKLDDISLPRLMMYNTASFLGGLSAAVLAGVCRAKVMGKPDVSITITNRTTEVREDSITSITSENYMQEVLTSKSPVILDAYATWCGPCKVVAPIYAELSNEMSGKIKFVKLNVEEQQALAKVLKIEAMPTFLIFKNGKIVDRHVGLMNKAEFLSLFVKHLV